MKSGISLCKLVWEDIRSRQYLLALMCIGTFLVYPVAYLLLMQSTASQFSGMPAAYRQQVSLTDLQIRAAMNYLGAAGGVFIPCVAGCAALSAITGYAYLDSSVKVDFYHAVPIRREVWFFVPFLGGAAVTILPYLANVALALFGVGAVMHVFSMKLLSRVLIAVVMDILAFFACYCAAILAMVLTGQILMGVLGAMAFFIYGPCMYFLWSILKMTFYKTYLDTGMDLVYCLSPVGAMGWFDINPFAAVVAEVVFIIIFLALALYLFVRRPSETAGRPYVYPALAPVVKGFISVPAAILSGLIFREIAPMRAGGCMIFGVIVGALLANCVIEFIYSHSLRTIWPSRLSAILILLVSLGLTSVFQYDLTGYDSYMPDRDKVEAIAIGDDFLTEPFGSMNRTYYLPVRNYSQNLRAVLDERLYEDCDEIYAMLEKAARRGNEAPMENGVEQESINISYGIRLTSGRRIYRHSIVTRDEWDEMLRVMTQKQGFREKIYPFRDASFHEADTITVAPNFSLNGETKRRMLTESQMADLRAALIRDTEALSWDLLTAEVPCLSIELSRSDNYYQEDVTSTEDAMALDGTMIIYGISVYPSYKETLAYLASIEALPASYEDITCISTDNPPESLTIYRMPAYEEGTLDGGGMDATAEYRILDGDEMEEIHYYTRDKEAMQKAFGLLRPVNTYALSYEDLRSFLNVEVSFRDGSMRTFDCDILDETALFEELNKWEIYNYGY